QAHTQRHGQDPVEELEGIIDIVWPRIEGHGASGRTITLKLKYADFRQITRARSQPEPIASRETFSTLAHELLDGVLPVPLGVRLLGLTLSGLVHGSDGQATPADGVAEKPQQGRLVF
ncbi:MAG: DNA polymerase IV, partial [Pseudomonadota bacterium]